MTLQRTILFGVGAAVLMMTLSFRSSKEEMPLPSNFPEPIYDLRQNPVTESGFALGKKLFYDGNLSKNGIVSCGFCHQQPSAFTHHGHTLSHGVNDRIGKRNAPAIANVIWQKTFFWDGGVTHLDFVPLNALENPKEMDETLENVLQKLNNSPEYRLKFEEAFGSPDISSTLFLKALGQFMASLITSNSRYDRYVRNESEVLTADELEGLRLFRQKCSTCHASDLFTDGSYRNNGTSANFRFDKGREEITLDSVDRGKFKVPSLRNVEYTDPYMHDGSINTLEDVIDHYRANLHYSPTVDTLLVKGGKPKIAITDLEKKQLVAFLKTLTDTSFLKNKRYSEY